MLTEGGHQMLATWLVTCGDPDAPSRVAGIAQGALAAAGFIDGSINKDESDPPCSNTPNDASASSSARTQTA